MTAYKMLTHQEHVELAATVCEVKRLLDEVYWRAGRNFPKSHRVMQRARRVREAFDLLRSALDDEFHRATSDEQFRLTGHVYYTGKPARGRDTREPANDEH